MGPVDLLYASLDEQEVSSYEANFIEHGQDFLRGLMLHERKYAKESISTVPSDLLIQLRNWQRVVALILRKLSSAYRGHTDDEYRIRRAIFILDPKEAKWDIHSLHRGSYEK